MNEIQTFNFKNFGVRTFVDKNGNPWFCAKDVCDVLGYKKSRNAIARHTRSEGALKRGLVETLSNGREQEFETTFIDERNVYRLVMHSELPEAEAFQDWVCGDVLPTIRKTGCYGQPAIPQTLPEALRLAADLAEKNQILEHKIREDTPKVCYLDRIMAANEAMTITNAAKVIGYPPRKFKDYLRQIGFLYSNADTPKQEHILSGRAVLRYAHWTDSNGTPQEKPYCHLTAKGLQYIYVRLVSDGLIEQANSLTIAA